MKTVRPVCSLFVLLLALIAHSSRHELTITSRAFQPPLPPVASVPAGLSQPTSRAGARIGEAYGKLPLSFEANQGQADDDVKFLSRGNGYQLYLTATEAVLQLRHKSTDVGKEQPSTGESNKSNEASQHGDSTILRMKLVDSNPASPATGLDQLPGKTNYLIGNDRAKWRTAVPNYAKVEYQQVWTGVNLVYYGNQRQLEYDFVVAPGADPQTIQLEFEGADKVEIDANGNLVLHASGGEVEMQKPFVYQEVNGTRLEIAGSYQIQNPESKIQNPLVGFRVGDYDTSLPLVIDPVLSYSTYLGGGFDDEGHGIAVDSAGNAYLTGATSSANFPLEKAYDGTNTARERTAFVTKLNAAGSALEYSTYLGGTDDDEGNDIAVDAQGNAYVTGFTGSTDFPTMNPRQANNGGFNDVFVAKLNPAGSDLVYSTYLGGTEEDGGAGIAVDASGAAYVTGFARSSNFPTANPVQPANAGPGLRDAFVAKLNPAGSALVYSTYLGGSSGDEGRDIALDAAGNVYVAGQTFSTNFRSANPLQPQSGGGSSDAFVAKLNAAGAALVYSTYLGGSSGDEGEGIAADSSGNAYVTGRTDSVNFPTKNAFQGTKKAGTDAFVAKLNPDGSDKVYSTFLGGDSSDYGNGIAADASGNVGVMGSTESANFPMVSPLQALSGGDDDVFVTKLNTSGSALLFSSYLGGSGEDLGLALALDSTGSVFVTGETKSTNFPPEKPFQSMMAGVSDVFVAKISDPSNCPAPLSSDAATNAVAADILALTDAMPSNGPPLLGSSLKVSVLKVTVTWLLESQADATLVVRLFDQEGDLRGDAGLVEIKRPTVCPPPTSSQEFVFDGSQIELLPRNGIEVTELRLSAIMSAGNGQIIKRADLNYRLVPDVISFEGTAKINGVDAPGGSQLPANGTVDFASELRYRVANDLKGKIRLQAFNSNGGAQIATKDLTPAVASTALPTTWNTPLDFQFTVPPSVSEISVVASLLSENGTLLKSSTPLFYRNKPLLDIGTQLSSAGDLFVPNPAGYFVNAGEQVGPLALKFKEDLHPSLVGSKFEVRLTQSLNDGTLIRVSSKVRWAFLDGFPRPSCRLLIGDEFPDDADKWEFQFLIHPPNNAPQIASGIATLTINRIRIQRSSPPVDRKLVAGTNQEFVYLVAYNTTPDVEIRVRYTYVLANGKDSDFKTFANGFKARNASNSTGEEFRFSLNLPKDLKLLQVHFFGLNQGTQSKVRTYNKIGPFSLTIPAGPSQTDTGLGVDATTINNTVNRLLTPSRNASNAKNAALQDAGLLKPNPPPPPRTNRAGMKAAAEALTPAALFKDFVGINATWQFDPPIPADGSFVADLKFYYSAGDFPDDPNFNEASMTVIAFDPAAGTLVSLPTTLDLTAKTATARVNGLMPMYSLGVFGPFAHRTLSFPVLRSLDDFTTQLNLANFGSGGATLTSRAYTPTGQLYNETGIVNPMSATLPAGRTLTGSVGELFNFPGLLDGGWMQTHADKNFIAGSQVLGKDNRLDALGLPAFYAGTQILTNVQYDSTMTTEIHIANVTNFTTNLTLDLLTAAGTLAGSYETSLEPRETFAYGVQDIFSTLTPPFAGYLIARAEMDLAAAAIQVSATEIMILNGQVALPGGAATKLYAAYVLTDGVSVTTRLNLVNPTTSPANLTLRFVNQAGSNVAAPVSLQLAAGQQSQRDIREIFGLSTNNLVYGSLIVESSITGVLGDTTYSSPSAQFKFRAALPLENEPAKFFAFAHLDNRNNAFTDVGIFNAGTQAAQVEVRVLRADGTETGKTTLQVGAGAHYSDFLDTIVGASFGQVGGLFTLSSNQPIVTAAAYGPLSGTTLSSLQAHAFDPSAFTQGNTSVSAASYKGPDLAAESIVAVFGVNLATATQVAASVPLPIELAGTTVRVRDSAGVDRLAPLFFVSAGQINYQLPPGSAAGPATVTISSGDGALSTGAINVAAVAPGVFTADASGSGFVSAYIVRVRSDNSVANEAITRYDDVQQKLVAIPVEFTADTQAIVLVLFGTGWRGRSSQSAVGVKIGGTDVPVAYAGAQGGFVGLDQMNVDLLRSLIGRGEMDIVVTVDGKTANTVRINVK